MNFHIGLGLEYRISNKIAAYLNYNIAKSFKEENQDSTEGEKYELDRRAITIGLLFKISKKIRVSNGIFKKIVLFLFLLGASFCLDKHLV